MLSITIFKKATLFRVITAFLMVVAFVGATQQAWADETSGKTLSIGAIAQDTGSPALGLSDATAKAGETFSVDVQITNNPGILGATLEVSYDSKLTLNSVTNGEAFKALDMTKPGELKSGSRIHWDATDISDDDVKDGVIATLTFKVPESASAGTTYSISIASAVIDGKVDVYDRNLAPVDLQPASCYVSVSASEPAHATHSYGAWNTVTQPTCTKAGKRERSCSVCGDKVSEAIPALGHKWDSGKVVKAATYDVAGIRLFTCETCGETRTEAIPKLNRTSLSKASIGTIGAKTYTGKALAPNPRVKAGGKVLVEGRDYTVEYKNNKNVGTATVAIAGKGAYSGKKTTTFKIVAAKNTVTVKSASLKKNLTLKSLKKAAKAIALPKATAKFGKVAWKVAKKDKKKTLSLKNGKVMVKKGAEKGAYTMSVKAAVAKSKNYGAANSKEVTVKVTIG